MYIPKHFAEDRMPVLHSFIEAESFGALITMGESGLIASHIPMVLEREGDSLGLLKGHISRANPQWREITRRLRRWQSSADRSITLRQPGIRRRLRRAR